MWEQFVQEKEKWIGGIVEEFADMFSPGATTEITDITITQDNYGSHMFSVHGKDFNETFNVKYGGIGGKQTDGWLTFSCPYHPGFRIKMKGN